MPSHPWYSVFFPRPDAEIHLYCLPCAGGSAAMFEPWARLLPATFELRAVRLPGRHARDPVPAFPDFDAAADAIADGIGGGLREPYVLFGHSMGALITHRLLGVIERRGLPRPALSAVASSLVQGIPPHRLPDPALPEPEFVAALAELGGVPSEVLGDPEVLAFTLPALRADFRMCRAYEYRPREPPSDVPTTVFGGTTDRITPVGEMTLWNRHARNFLGVRRFPGGHFFFRPDAGPLVAAVVADTVAATAKSIEMRSNFLPLHTGHRQL